MSLRVMALGSGPGATASGTAAASTGAAAASVVVSCVLGAVGTCSAVSGAVVDIVIAASEEQRCW